MGNNFQNYLNDIGRSLKEKHFECKTAFQHSGIIKELRQKITIPLLPFRKKGVRAETEQ